MRPVALRCCVTVWLHDRPTGERRYGTSLFKSRCQVQRCAEVHTHLAVLREKQLPVPTGEKAEWLFGLDALEKSFFSLQGIETQPSDCSVDVSLNRLIYICFFSICYINLLATDFFFQILAHLVFKMWIIQKPNKVALWNKRHLERKKMEIIQHV